MINLTKLRQLASGRDKWFAMGREEKSYFIDFDTEWEAGEWMQRQKKDRLEWLEREGVHIVKQRVLSEADEMLIAAADRIDALTVKCQLYGASLDKADREIDALKQDAARYHFLRETARFTWETNATATLSFRRLSDVQHDVQVGYRGEIFDADVDRGVDAARAALALHKRKDGTA